MPRRKLNLVATDEIVEQGLEKIRDELEIPAGFPEEVLEEARVVEPSYSEEDLTDIPFLTIDPVGARDLDQAFHLERRHNGYRVRYAIADVAAFVSPGGSIDAEARRRGLTLYGPDRRTLLYPGSISEGAASLLPDESRPALVWTLDLDESGELTATHVRRAMVRSRAQLDYSSTQLQLDSGAAPDSIRLLTEVGRLRQLIEVDRGAVSLPIPDQVIVKAGDGWQLVYRVPLPIEGWNAEISLLTGIAAATMMVGAGSGVLRTLPPANASEIEWIRRVAGALEVAWPRDVTYPELIRSLNPRLPSHSALFAEATSLFSGAGYQVLDGVVLPHEHSALATVYAHATAPLRRLVDRFVGETCLAICAGDDPPGWVDEALVSIPQIMARAATKSGQYEARCLDLVEAAVLSNQVGMTFDGVVVDVDEDQSKGQVQLRDPAVHATIEGDRLELGAEVDVRLVEVSLPDRRVIFERV